MYRLSPLRIQDFFRDNRSETRYLARAPGRVNLIGEHTDYNDGFVCPIAIDRVTSILASPRSDALVRMHSVSFDQTVEFPIDHEVPKDGPAWSLYAKGVAEAMRRRVSIARGFDALINSDVPLGGGLSSSASFEVATALTLLTVNEQQLPPEELALACQWAEHHYAGAPCGVMDQFICTMGQEGHAMLLDCRDRSTRQVLLHDPDLRVVISNTNVKHELTGGEYAVRRRQCADAVAYIHSKFPGVSSLRDVTMEQLDQLHATMGRVIFRCARHVITEIERTVKFADALEKGDYDQCGRLMYASHASLRDDFAVSCTELDVLVEIARSINGVYGARMTGGGFGGSIVVLCQNSAIGPLRQVIDEEYPRKIKGGHATTFVTHPSASASISSIP